MRKILIFILAFITLIGCSKTHDNEVDNNNNNDEAIQEVAQVDLKFDDEHQDVDVSHDTDMIEDNYNDEDRNLISEDKYFEVIMSIYKALDLDIPLLIDYFVLASEDDSIYTDDQWNSDVLDSLERVSVLYKFLEGVADSYSIPNEYKDAHDLAIEALLIVGVIEKSFIDDNISNKSSNVTYLELLELSISKIIESGDVLIDILSE